MRCLRTGAETPIDPRLIDLLYRIALRTKQKIVLVSGFRAPMFSLATLSYHTRGMRPSENGGTKRCAATAASTISARNAW